MTVTKQLVARLAAIPAVVLSEPASSIETEAVLVLGPAMTKLLKSTRSWNSNKTKFRIRMILKCLQ